MLEYPSADGRRWLLNIYIILRTAGVREGCRKINSFKMNEDLGQLPQQTRAHMKILENEKTFDGLTEKAFKK